MSVRETPPFRADHVGSLLRPPELLAARAEFAAGTLPAEELRAELLRIRQQGYALVDQELEEGLRAIAAPIRDGDGRVIAAVNVSAHASRGSADEMRDDLLEPLLRTAALIEEDLRGTGNGGLTLGGR